MSLAQFLSPLGGNARGMGNQTMQAMPGMPQSIGGITGGAFNPAQPSPMQQLTAIPDMVQTPPDMMQQIERAMPQMQQQEAPQVSPQNPNTH